MRGEAELVEVRVKPTENTTLAKLSVLDMIKMLIAHFAKNDAAELDALEKVSADEMRNKASLSKFIENAGKALNEKNASSVTLAINSQYLPYLADVIDPITGYGRFYVFKIYEKKLPFNLNYNVVVRMYKKVTKIDMDKLVNNR